MEENKEKDRQLEAFKLIHESLKLDLNQEKDLVQIKIKHIEELEESIKGIKRE